MGCIWSSLNVPGTGKGPVSSNFEVGRFPFSHNWTPNWTSAEIRMGSQFESEKVEIILAQEELNGLHLVQLECSRYWKPPVSSKFEVGRFSILGNLARAGVQGE